MLTTMAMPKVSSATIQCSEADETPTFARQEAEDHDDRAGDDGREDLMDPLGAQQL